MGKKMGILIIFNFILLSLCFMLFKNLGGIAYFKQRSADKYNISTAHAKVKMFENTPINTGKIIVLGDSQVTNGCWNELISSNAINRGIGGNTTKNVLDRIDEILNRKPSKVILMVGINDLANGIPIEESIKNFSLILDNLKSINTEIYVNSIFPINFKRKILNFSNTDIKNLNSKINELCLSKDVFFIDIYDNFLNNGHPNDNLTFDGLHLNSAGYNIWAEELNKVILKESLD